MEQSEQVRRIGTGIRPQRQLEELAKHMACLAHKIRDLAIAAFENGTASSAMRDICESFREVLNSDLPVAQFCDMFAQTVTYGLFAARYIQPDSTYFQSRGAIGPIPHTSSFLKQLSGTTTWAELGNEPFWPSPDETSSGRKPQSRIRPARVLQCSFRFLRDGLFLLLDRRTSRIHRTH